jgi:hypothetical protein
MELDFSRPWRIVPARSPSAAGLPFPDPARTEAPADFAAAELAAVLGRMTGEAPLAGGGSESDRIVFLHTGEARPRGSGNPIAPPSFSWRVSEGRVEIFGEDGRGLVRGVYDFLDALGARWVAPGPEGERLPPGKRFELAASSRRSPEPEIAATLVLGHGAYLSRWEEYLAWAARTGYSRVFIHTTHDALALGAAPERLFERLRGGIARGARRFGLALELGGHLLSSFLPRALFREDSDLFRKTGGRRSPEHNFCSSNPRALELAAASFAAFAAAHPEIDAFHAWPDDLPGGGWCSCSACASLSPAAQYLQAARALAAALAEARPGALLSFLAYNDSADVADLDLSGLPANLELLWAPRSRCRAHGLDEAVCALNEESLDSYRAAASAWRAAGGGPVSVFEYWEDAVLFKTAVPPLSRAMAGDIAAYAGKAGTTDTRRPGAAARPGSSAACAADSVGILLTGGRLPFAPRPNPWLMPLLLRRGGAEGALADWIGAAYGPAAEPMRRYWAALEAAWALDLDLEPGETEWIMPAKRGLDLDGLPTDWGDPWLAAPERLAARCAQSEELFDLLRDAEKALAEALAIAEGESAAPGAAAVSAAPREARGHAGLPLWVAALRAESREYAVAGNLLELDCARLSVYREFAAGQDKAAADIALLALGPWAAVSKALGAAPDRRERRETRFLLSTIHVLRLKAIRRRAMRFAGSRALAKAAAALELGLRYLGLPRAWERPR